MYHKLKIVFSTAISLALASIVPLTIIAPVKTSNDIAAYNIKTDIKTNNVQTVNSIDEINFYSSNLSNSFFAVVKNEAAGDALFGWGLNDSGQLGLGHNNSPVQYPTFVQKVSDFGAEIIDIAVGSKTSALICKSSVRDEYLLYTSGDDTHGQRGNDLGDKPSSVFEQIGGYTSQVMQIVASANSFRLLLANGQVYTWGSYLEGQLGLYELSANVDSPTTISALSGVKKIGALEQGGWAWVNNDVYVWGNGKKGEMGNGTTESLNTPTKVILNTKDDPTITHVTSNASTMYVVGFTETFMTKRGYVYAWGDNSDNQIPPSPPAGGGTELSSVDDQVIATSKNTVHVIGANGSTMAWGSNSAGQLGIGSYSVTSGPSGKPLTHKFSENVKFLYSQDTVLAVDNNMIYAWGDNQLGQYGIGTISKPYNSPTQVDPFSINPSNLTSKIDNTSIVASDALSAIYSGGILNTDELKKYVDGFDSFPSDVTFAVKGEPSLSNNTIAITLTANKSYSSPYANRTDSSFEQPLTITNFLSNTEITVRAGGNRASSATEMYEDLSNNVTFENIEKYVVIKGKIEDDLQDLSINQEGLENPIDNINGILKFNIVLKNYYEDGVIQDNSKSFPITLEGFISDSNIAANPDGNKTLVAQVVADSFKTGTAININEIKKYIDLNFNNDNRVEVTDVDTIVNREVGSIKVTLTISNYYKNGEKQPSDYIELENFKNTPTSKLVVDKNPPHNKDQSALAAFKTLVADAATSNAIDKDVLGSYVTGIDSFPSDVTFHHDGYDINNIDGCFTLTIVADKWYEYGELVDEESPPMPLTFDGFIKDLRIVAKDGPFNISANDVVKNTTPDKMEEQVKKFITIDNDIRTVIDWASVSLKSDEAGVLIVTFGEVTNYYENGILATLPIIINIRGFAINTSISDKQDPLSYDKTASETANELFKSGEKIDQAVLSEYIDLKDVPPETDITVISTIVDDKTGEITLEIEVTDYYQNGDRMGSKKFTLQISGFKILSTSMEWIWIVSFVGFAFLICLIMMIGLLKKKITIKKYTE